MAIKPFQSGLISVGHFDFLDMHISELKGGEVVVFDSISTFAGDKSSADVYSQDGYRTILRLATGLDEGPFLFADTDSTSSFPTPGFERTSLFAQQQPFGRSYDSSGKIAAYTTGGLYSISSDAVEGDSISDETLVNTKLYVSPTGRLTTVASSSLISVAKFIEYRKGSKLRGFDRPIQSVGSHFQGDTIVVYKV